MSTQINQKEKKSRKSKPQKTKKSEPNKSLRRFRRRATFLILVVFAGFVAFTGWVQYDIPEGYGGLIHTKFTYHDGKKAGGFDSALTVHDGLHWRWEKLFPTNLTMHLYPLDIRTVTLSSSGTLPSSDIYLAFIEESGSGRFDWKFSFDITYRLREEAVPRLASQEGIFPEDLDDFFAREEQLMEGELYAYIKDFTPPDGQSALLDRIRAKLNETHPYLEITSLAPETLSLPDLVFYEKARSLYFAYMDERNRALEEMIGQVAPRTAVNEEKMKVLEEYGKVLTEYPVLVDFFALDPDNDFGRYTPADLMPEDLEGSE